MEAAIKRHRRKFQTLIRREYRKHGTIPLVARVCCGVEEDLYSAEPGESPEDFTRFIRRTAAARGSWIAFVSCPFDPDTDDEGDARLLEIFPHDEPEEFGFSLAAPKGVG